MSELFDVPDYRFAPDLMLMEAEEEADKAQAERLLAGRPRRRSVLLPQPKRRGFSRRVKR